MQIDPAESVCPACGAAELEFVPVLHHMPCAYVGPVYDFLVAAVGYVCPKCRRDISAATPDGEIVGTSARCRRCRVEIVVSPSAPAML